ncbi:MAG: hypothetical protein QNJ51_03365 [Calothrix sp. MO_167.B12]|nr:hypothetical protein [Calothrix sp. MO_167.B12]
MGFDFDALVFYGFFVNTAQSESELWQAGSDVIPGEGFVERFQRRLAVVPQLTNLQIHEVGIGQRYDEGLPPGAVYVYVRESVTMGSMGKASSLDFDTPSSWEQKVRQFCNLMEIPWQEPAWYWFVTASG